jgi:hypothetical protein
LKMPAKSVMPKKPEYLGWKFFEDLGDETHVFCVLCASEEKSTLYKVTDGVTCALKRHLTNVHAAIGKEVEVDTKKRKEEKEREMQDKDQKRRKLGIGTSKTLQVPKNQPTIKAAVNKLTKVDPQGGIQKKYDDSLLDLLSCNLLSFNLVDSPEFKRFVELLNPSINLKARKTYSRMTSKYSEEILSEVKKLIEEFTDASVSVTADIWTSRTLDAYISMTVHFVDKLFRLHAWTPAVQLFNEKHSGENIKEVLEGLLEDKLGMDLNSLPMFATVDNAANMIRGIRMSMLDVYACVNHTGQLAVLDSFKVDMLNN